ncbi:MAG TPA: Calx-beta domain-containing protein [Candidatus Limnocylindrales bacterium]|nr:Calx-beta domain-containing protein [Candidatus Limnocylindrales bacterium]
MNRQLLARATFPILLLFVLRSPALSQVKPNLIVGPNQYEFVSGGYFVSQGVTNAVITVHFIPGDPSFSGSVNYATTGGTAVMNQDYKPVSGTLWFSGASYRSFNVPITVTNLTQQKKSVGLVLTPSPNDSNALILRNVSELVMNVAPPPALSIAAGPNGTVTISWQDDGTGPLLEKSIALGSNWSVVGVWPSLINGRMTVTDVASSPASYYRLHRPQ